jgi:hypothetical protein
VREIAAPVDDFSKFSLLQTAKFRQSLALDALSYCDYAEAKEKITHEDLMLDRADPSIPNWTATIAAPWRKGGKTAQGMDATGLVNMVYLLNGVNAPRTAQIAHGQKLRLIDDPLKAEMGDVLYWGDDEAAIYLGDKKCVYASREDQKVVILEKDLSSVKAVASLFGEPKRESSSSDGGGCNAAWAGIALLALLPLASRKGNKK